MDTQTIRRAAPIVYVIAIMVAVFFASGNVVGAVAAIGALVIALIFTLTKGTSKT